MENALSADPHWIQNIQKWSSHYSTLHQYVRKYYRNADNTQPKVTVFDTGIVSVIKFPHEKYAAVEALLKQEADGPHCSPE